MQKTKIKIKVKHYRSAIVFVTLCQVVFLLLSVWHIHLSLKGISSYYGVPVLNPIQVSKILLVTASSLSIAMIFLVFQFFKIKELEEELALSKMSNEAAGKTIELLRSHRHDFLNHLQVILGYIQLRKADLAVTYIKDINKELKAIRAVSDIEMPEVAVLLLAKKEDAAQLGIKMEYRINTNLSSIIINQLDLVRILGNLVDNAIYAIKQYKSESMEEKVIVVTFETEGNKLMLEVKNTHSLIKDTEKIFRYGYTTKGKDGSGIGLYTVKKLIEDKYGGHITVTSDETSGTSFLITV